MSFRKLGTQNRLGYGYLAALIALGVGAQLGGCGSQASVSTTTEGTEHGKSTASAVSASAPTFRKLDRGAHPLARPEFDMGPLDANKSIANLSLVFKPSAAQVADREALREALLDPASPSYHKWLTPEQYAARFGAKPADVARANDWLTSQGLTVHKTSRLGTRVTFSGRVRDLQSAFRSDMRQYKVGGELHYAMASAPSLPSELQSVVLGVHNLHDFYPRPSVHSLKEIPDYKNGTAKGIAPPDWATLYDVNPLYTTGIGGTAIDGAGVTIAIVGIAAIAQSDVDAFRTKFSLPASTFTQTLVPNTGALNGQTGGAGVEAVLDVEWSGGIAKGATVNYVLTGANDGNVDDATFYAIDENLAPILSESWGGCEADIAASDADIVEVYGSAANVLGITYLASSGDSGAASCLGFGISGLYVNIPAAYPGVTSVGGTEFPTGTITYGSDGFATAYSASETVWNESPSAASPGAGGGGISVLFPRPAYQSGLATCPIVGSLPVAGTTPSAMRQVPDISASAAGSNNPIFIECSYVNSLGDCAMGGGSPKILGIGGTSASAPALAGVVALINQATGGRLGNINPMLYTLEASTPTAFHDIKTGNNEITCTAGTDTGCPGSGGLYGFAAATGYDCATGVGSVDANNLVKAWAALAPTTTTLIADPTTTTEGANVSLTATTLVPAVNASILGGSTYFTFETYAPDGKYDLSWPLGSGTITSATTATGTATISVPIPPGLVKSGAPYADVVAAYGGDAHHLASTSAKVRVNFGAISFCASPGTAAVAAGGAVQYAAVGGMTPVKWLVNADSTCDSQGKNCSTLDEATGAFTAGTGAPGYVEIVAFDKYGAESYAAVTVGAATGAPPWGDGGTLSTCGALLSDGGIIDSGSGDDGSTIGDDSGFTGDDSGFTGDDSGSSTGDDGGIVVTPPVDSGANGDASASDAGTSSGGSSSGCGCTTAARSDSPVGTMSALVLGLGLVARRRRTQRARK